MNLDTRLEASSSVVTREVGGEMMLMDLESGTYFGLDAIGGRAWQAFEDGQTIEELCAQIEQDFEVEPEQLREDMLSLARKLLDNNLVTKKQD
jgi:lipoate-protein ligase A